MSFDLGSLGAVRLAQGAKIGALLLRMRSVMPLALLFCCGCAAAVFYFYILGKRMRVVRYLQFAGQQSLFTIPSNIEGIATHITTKVRYIKIMGKR